MTWEVWEFAHMDIGIREHRRGTWMFVIVLHECNFAVDWTVSGVATFFFFFLWTSNRIQLSSLWLGLKLLPDSVINDLPSVSTLPARSLSTAVHPADPRWSFQNLYTEQTSSQHRVMCLVHKCDQGNMQRIGFFQVIGRNLGILWELLYISEDLIFASFSRWPIFTPSILQVFTPLLLPALSCRDLWS